MATGSISKNSGTDGKRNVSFGRDTAGLAGCVYVELRGERGYFGLLAVEPSRQRRGLGGRLAQEAEEYARAAGCLVMDIMTVNVRTELPPIYRKMGYVETGMRRFQWKCVQNCRAISWGCPSRSSAGIRNSSNGWCSAARDNRGPCCGQADQVRMWRRSVSRQ